MNVFHGLFHQFDITNLTPLESKILKSKMLPDSPRKLWRGSGGVERGQGQGYLPGARYDDPEPNHPDPGRGLPGGISKLVHFDKEICFCKYL